MAMENEKGDAPPAFFILSTLIVKAYKHMGSTGNANGGMAQEVVIKCSATAKAAKPLVKKVFRNDLVNKDVEVNVLTSLLRSHNCFHIG